MNPLEGRTMAKKRREYLFLPLILITLFIYLLFPQEGFGTELYVNPSLGGNCTRPSPCRIHTALILANQGDTIYFRQGTYTGEPLASEVIYLTKDIALLGGWDGSPTGPLVRDPEAFPTILDGQNSRRVIRVNGGILPSPSPTIDGFTIINGNATGLVNTCSPSASGCGGGIFVYQARARILNNKIHDNQALVSANPSLLGYGGGLHLEASPGALVRGNLFQGNKATSLQNGSGGGGGLSIYGTTGNPSNIIKNQFINNSGSMGGGIVVFDQNSPLIQDNFLENNHGIMGAGLALIGAGTIIRNTFQNHQDSSAVFLEQLRGTFDSNTLINNTLGVNLIYGDSPHPRLSNNIIAGTKAVIAQGSGLSPLNLDMEHNTLVGMGSGAAVIIPASNYVTLSMTNNIISGFPVGVDNSGYPNSTVIAHNTLFGPGVTNPGMNVNFQNSLTGDPAFKNPAAGDYHIRFTSAAKDAGSSTFTATEDIDGDPRPIGGAPDIGADEYRPAGYLYLPLIVK
jgi:hypothetical protein